MIRILMVEDDSELAEVLTQYLSRYNIDVTTLEDPYLALSEVVVNSYDLVILDLTLPGMDGLEVCKAIRKRQDIPIIISSARSDISDKVVALELGADDYLPKPYDPRELEVRIKSILRRYNVSTVESVESSKLFTLDEAKRNICKAGEVLKLTAAEYEVLALLIKRTAFIVSREEIIDNSKLLGGDDEHSSSLTVIINRLRHKIEPNPKQPQYLQTVRGMGYKFVQ